MIYLYLNFLMLVYIQLRAAMVFYNHAAKGSKYLPKRHISEHIVILLGIGGSVTFATGAIVFFFGDGVEWFFSRFFTFATIGFLTVSLDAMFAHLEDERTGKEWEFYGRFSKPDGISRSSVSDTACQSTKES